MNQAEFDNKWKQVLPIVEEILAGVLIRTPADAAPNNLVYQDRSLALADAYSSIQGAFDLHDLKLFRSRPSYLAHENDGMELLSFVRRAAFYASVEDEATEAKVMSTQTMPLMRINAPAWFKNPEFVRWLNDRRTATWHGGEEKPHTFSDAFFTFCDGGGSDYPGDEVRPGIPDDIWRHLEFMVAEEHGWGTEVLVWVSNLEA